MVRIGIGFWSVILVMVLASITTPAEESPKADTPVDNALVVQKISFRGTEDDSAALLATFVQTKVGAEISPDMLSKDIKTLYKSTGFFSDIAVDVEPAEGGGLEVIYRLTANPKIGSINFIGNDKLSIGKLKEGVKIKPGETYTDKDRWESERAILKTYKEKGYYLAEVQTHADVNSETNTVAITFEVNEGTRIKIEEINFIGAAQLSEKTLAKQLKTQTDKHFDEDLLDQDMTSLRYYYQDRGFSQVKVIGFEKRFTEDKTGLIIDVTVDEGIQYIIGSYEVEIQQSEKPAFSEKKIRNMLEPAEGEIFNRGEFQKTIDKIYQAYQDKGYLLAEVLPVSEYDEENGTVDLVMNINEGDVLIINEVKINGLEKTKENVIRRELNQLDIKPGEFLDVRALRKARQRFFQMGSFIRDVDFVPNESEDNNRDLTVNIAETPRTGMFSLGGGYGSEGGIFGLAEVGENNLFGRAYRVHLKGELGARDRHNAEIRFSTPWILGTPTRLNASLYNTKRERRYYGQVFRNLGYDRYVYQRKGGSVTLGRPIAHDVDLSIRLKNERLNANRSDFTELVNRSTRSITFLLSRDTRDYRTSVYDPMAGSFNTLSYEFSGGFLRADNEFQKYSADSSKFFNIWRNHVFAAHVRGGYMESKTSDSVYLFLERFILGGIDTVRGYDDYEIFPRNANGQLNYNGGNKVLYANIEYRIPLAAQLTGTIFFDIGQVWDESRTNIFEDLDFKKGAGVGVRFDMFGMLARIEWGYGFDHENDLGIREPKGKFHFTIGPGF